LRQPPQRSQCQQGEHDQNAPEGDGAGSDALSGRLVSMVEGASRLFGLVRRSGTYLPESPRFWAEHEVGDFGDGDDIGILQSVIMPGRSGERKGIPALRSSIQQVN
jgi:hypothetical protein